MNKIDFQLKIQINIIEKIIIIEYERENINLLKSLVQFHKSY